jgi:hypothetical protein
VTIVQFCPFLPSGHDLNMATPLEVCTMEEQHAIVQFFFFWYLNEWLQHWSINDWLPNIFRTVCHSEVCRNGLRYLKASRPVLMRHTGKDVHLTHKQINMEHGEDMRTVGQLLWKLQDHALMLLDPGASLYCINHLYVTPTQHKWTTTEPYHSSSLSDLQLQYDWASAVLPII